MVPTVTCAAHYPIKLVWNCKISDLNTLAIPLHHTNFWNSISQLNLVFLPWHICSTPYKLTVHTCIHNFRFGNLLRFGKRGTKWFIGPPSSNAIHIKWIGSLMCSQQPHGINRISYASLGTSQCCWIGHSTAPATSISCNNPTSACEQWIG